MDFRGTADYDTYEIYSEFDVASDEKVSDWIDNLNLPDGYTISGYMEIGWQGGFLILPRAYDNTEAGAPSEAPEEWQYSGMISRIPAESTGVTYKNGIPDLSGIPMHNHTVSEYIDVIGLERSTNQWPAIMMKEEHDLYTAAAIADLENQGVDTNGIELTSEYWTFYFVKEGEPNYYILSLDSRSFTKDEAIKIANGVGIKE